VTDELIVREPTLLGRTGAARVIASAQAPTSGVSDDGLINVRPFDLPCSPYLSERSRQLFVEQARQWETIRTEQRRLSAAGAPMTAMRASYNEGLLSDLAKQRARHPMSAESSVLAGVPVQIFTPRDANPGDFRVLLNLHGGGFLVGDRVSSEIESLPIAAGTGLRVVSVDYRMAPEHAYPAAVDDARAVYRQLLRAHPSGAIGVFGGSAGAILAAELVASLKANALPPPGALALLGAGACFLEGDSMEVFSAIDRGETSDAAAHPYLKGAALDDPMVSPVVDLATLGRFPPSLLISSTRDIGLSSVVYTHAKLLEASVDASLLVIEGLRHCFFYNPEFSESRQVYREVTRFFKSRLKTSHLDNIEGAIQ